MSRSRSLTELRTLVRAALAARKSGLSLEEVVQSAAAWRQKQAGPTRREILRATGAGAAIAVTGRLARAAPRQTPRIAIVGGGIAGLNAALTLHDAGIASTIYEASSVVGGRIHSNTATWVQNQTSEWCGEFIDSGHTTMFALVQRFGLTLVDMIAAQPAGSTDTLYFFNKYYSVSQAYADFQAIATQLEADANNLYPTTYDPATHSPRALQLDHLSGYQWIDKYVPGGHSSPLGAYIDSAYTNEFGLETDQQSSLNMVYSMGFQPDPSVFSIYGQSDQRYHVLGGNDRIPSAIAAALPPASINTNWWMESIRKNSDGTFALSFLTLNGVRSVTADHVILTLPFSVLRNLDYRQAGFDPLKQIAITQLGYGTNSKLILQCSERLWDGAGPWGVGDGNIYTDLYFQNTWDSSRGIPGKAGVLVAYMGGTAGLSLGGALTPFADAASSPQVVGYVQEFLSAAKRPWPGIESQWNGRATLSAPWKAPNLLGSYSCWRVGQYTWFSGYEGVRQGNCHFAGEHCSQAFQGFMEGGAEEGARAAQEIISDISV
jgi:monoamine oxidase